MSIADKIIRTTDLTRGVNTEHLGRLFSTGEINGHTFKISVVEDGAAVSLTGGTCTAYMMLYDGQTVVIDGTVAGNVATVTLPQLAYTVIGYFNITIRVTVSGNTHAIYNADGTMMQYTSDAIIDPGHVVPDIDEIREAYADVLAATANANAAAAFVPNIIAPAYDDTATYAEGDYCTYNNRLYQCNGDIDTAEAWTAAHWRIVTVADELGQASDEITMLSEGLGIVTADNYDFTEKSTASTSINYRLDEATGLAVSNADYILLKYAVTAGDDIYIESDDMWQFQNSATVPTTGASNRIGRTYRAGKYVVKVPIGATYAILSAPLVTSSEVDAMTPKVPPVDATLSHAGEAADAKATGDAVTQLSDEIGNVKSAVDQLDSNFVPCINLFNPDDPDLVENVELNSDGTTSSKTGYFASGYIPVRAGATICCHYPTGTYGNASKIVFYDSSKVRYDYATGSSITRTTDSNGYNYIKYTFSANTHASYIRLTGDMSGYAYYMYVYAAEMPSTYVPYTPNATLTNVDVQYTSLKNVAVTKDDVTFIENDTLSGVAVDFADVDNVSVSKSQTGFISGASENLVDLSAVVPGIIPKTGNAETLDTSGDYGTKWVTTDYIPVEPGETYALCIFPGVTYGSGFGGIPCFDANHNYITRVTQSGGSVGAIASRVTITIPNNQSIKYIRTSYYENYVNPSLADDPHKSAAKKWWQCQIFKASEWPGDMYVPYDSTDKLIETRLDSTNSAKYNCLFGKTAIWNGDSICAADGEAQGGWPGRIASANGMKFKNYAIAGGTIAENTGTDVHSVSATLDRMLTNFPNADYIIIEGGTNDADILGDAGIGTFDADDFSAEYIAGLDRDTFSGALESIFYRLVTTMKGKHIGYLIPQKMGHTDVLVTRRRTYFDRAIAICQKWGIPYLDLWNGLYFNWQLSAHWDQTMTPAENEAAGNPYRDGQHLTTTGYIIESPIIAEWMRTF